MATGRDADGASAAAGGYHRVQAERDLQSNWEVDLAHKLEDYLLKICSGEITEESESHIPVNFVEAALLLQGSVQVYSRKVEYLHSLVLRALEFLSQKRQEEQLEGTSDQPQDNGRSKNVSRDEDDRFWDLDDIPVEANICLDTRSDEASRLNNFVKPPANLVVLEGDCLDSGGDAGELESYLLATSDLYREFILLDPCDAVAVDDYLDGDKARKCQSSFYKGSASRKSFQSPNARSGGALHTSSARKSHDAHANRSPLADCGFEANKTHVGDDPPAPDMFTDGGFDVDDRHSDPGEFYDDFDDEDDDPWKPLNPHEPGSLKVKPFRKVKGLRRKSITSGKNASISLLFPPARYHGPICPELRKIWEMRNHVHETRKRRRESESLSSYEKLRQQLVNDGNQSFDSFLDPKDDNDGIENNAGIPDFDDHDNYIPDFVDDDEHQADNTHFGVDDPYGVEEANSQASLEELCRSHLDALLASIAETEKQSDLAARVTTWKHKIEKNLDEQDSHPEFDIHLYGNRILDKLSLDGGDSNVLSFPDVVRGEEKYDVARSFSALLQLVNNGDVELDRNGISGSVCFTAENPFYVRLLKNDKKAEEVQFRLSKKRVKSPSRKTIRKEENEKSSTELPLQPNGKFPVKVGKIGVLRCTPDGKKRRKSRLVEPVDLNASR